MNKLIKCDIILLGDYMNNKNIFLDLIIEENEYDFNTSIEKAINDTNDELIYLSESINSIDKIKVDCDKTDYILAASIGALCGILDIFLVGKPGESPFEDSTDKWFENRTMNFAKMYGYNGDNLSEAIYQLEKVFKIPYDQSIGGDNFKNFINLTPSNHHFKSLGHNPTILGLFFSIMNQFTNTSSFVSNGEFITLKNSENHFELEGNNILSKIFCGFINWLGHLFSDLSGSSCSALKGNRGMGIPSPLFSWINDIIVLKSKLGINSSDFDKDLNELAIEIFKKGYDLRFQTAQLIPVIVNELLVRTTYAIRRLISYYKNTNNVNRSSKEAWKYCEPFSNASIKRMLTISHGSFCIIDTSDAIIRSFIMEGGTFDIKEFIMRFNIIGIGRFAISLYGEGYRNIEYYKNKNKVISLEKEKIILENYMSGLKILSEKYNDSNLLKFVEDFTDSKSYIKGFDKTITLAIKRNVPEDRILKNKAEIDKKFGGK